MCTGYTLLIKLASAVPLSPRAVHPLPLGVRLLGCGLLGCRLLGGGLLGGGLLLAALLLRALRLGARLHQRSQAPRHLVVVSKRHQVMNVPV